MIQQRVQLDERKKKKKKKRSKNAQNIPASEYSQMKKKKKKQKCPKYSGIRHSPKTQTTPAESFQAFARALE
jgi:hypothetical protein